MLLTPSSIYYICDDQTNVVLSQVLDKSILEVSRKVVQRGDWPRLQVVHKDGNYFTLNNAQLQLCRHLEADGTCKRVKADVVPLADVPEHVRTMMRVPTPGGAADGTRQATGEGGSAGRRTGRGYQKLGQNDPEKEQQSSDSDSDHYSSSDNSDYGSDSECDCSDDDDDDEEDGEGDEEGDSSECHSSAAGSEHSTDDERECLI